MAYQVFARKYRPQTFAEIVGQEPVVRTLTNALRLGRIAQAYLFVGPRGTGKTSTARILAKALEATNGPTASFDPQEDICVEIAEGRCLDVLEIDGASNNSVEQVRELRDNVRYTPAKGRYKIYIIDEVHMLSTAAFNALLKTLEEPPAHVKFIFATTEVHKLPTTILSRCQRFDLHRIPEPLIRSHLAHICELEKVEAEPGALDAIARYAEGGLRDAESALDQAISFYGDRVSEADVLSLFGLTGFAPVAALGRALAQGDVGAVLNSARELAAAGKDLGKLSQDLLGFFRNLVIYQVSPTALEGDISTSEKSVLAEVSGLISRAAALGILEELSHLESRLRYALAKDVVFEVALIQMSQLKEKISLESILESLGGAPQTQASAPQSVPANPATVKALPPAIDPVFSSPPVKEASAPSPLPVVTPISAVSIKVPTSAISAPPASTITSSAVQTAWAAAVERFAQERPMEADTIRAVEFHACKADQIEVLLPKALEKKLFYLRSPKNLEILENALMEKLGTRLQLVYLVGEGSNGDGKAAPTSTTPAPTAPGKPAPPPPNMSQEAFLNDPVIQNALQIFEAKIVPPANK
jgi:DNA polymerase-3 subunit gamma/tau